MRWLPGKKSFGSLKSSHHIKHVFFSLCAESHFRVITRISGVTIIQYNFEKY
jgi:hypothetical protein